MQRLALVLKRRQVNLAKFLVGITRTRAYAAQSLARTPQAAIGAVRPVLECERRRRDGLVARVRLACTWRSGVWAEPTVRRPAAALRDVQVELVAAVAQDLDLRCLVRLLEFEVPV